MSSANVSFIASGTGAVTRTGQAKYRDIISAKDFGAVGDGVTDDSTALQNALNAAEATGSAVFLPATGAAYYIATGLTMPNGVGLIGEGTRTFVATTSPLSSWTRYGSWIVSSDLVNPAISTYGHGNFIDGVNFGFSQPTPGGSFTPTTYPYAIAVGPVGGNLTDLRNIFIFAATHGISINYTSGSGGGTGVNLSNILISAFKIGLYTENVNDTITIENFHVRNMFYNTTASVVTYNEANLIGWDCHYTDNPLVSGFEVFEARYGMKFTNGTCLGNTHSLFNCSMTNIQFNLNYYAMYAAGATIVTGCFENITAQTVNAPQYLFDLQADNVNIMMSNLSISYAEGGVLIVGGGTGGKVNIANMTCQSYGSGQVCLAANNGAVISLGNRFITKRSGAGAYMAGAGNLESLQSLFWNPISSPTTVTGTLSGSYSPFTFYNYWNPYYSGVLQFRLIGNITITTPQAGGSISIRSVNYPELLVSGISATTAATQNFDSNWIDLSSANNYFGQLEMSGTAGVVYSIGNITVLFR